MTKPNTAQLELSALSEAIEDGFARFSAWQDLDVLSKRTELDAVELDERSVRWDGGSFEADLTVYVGLTYGDTDKDGFSTSDSFPGHVRGHLDEYGSLVIDDVKVDTSTFFE